MKWEEIKYSLYYFIKILILVIYKDYEENIVFIHKNVVFNFKHIL